MASLTLADEIVVLMLDDEDGDLRVECSAVAGPAIAGGILMELALLSCIDTDLQSLFIVNTAPTGDELLDEVLQEISAETTKHDSTWWIDQLSTRHRDLVERVRNRLVAAGILREEQQKYLWFFSRRAYPQVSGREEREAKSRLMSILFNDEIPNPRDTLLLGLANSAGVLSVILTEDQLEKVAQRVEDVAALEEIGRSVGVVSSQIRDAMVSIMSAQYHP